MSIDIHFFFWWTSLTLVTIQVVKKQSAIQGRDKGAKFAWLSSTTDFCGVSGFKVSEVSYPPLKNGLLLGLTDALLSCQTFFTCINPNQFLYYSIYSRFRYSMESWTCMTQTCSIGFQKIKKVELCSRVRGTNLCFRYRIGLNFG